MAQLLSYATTSQVYEVEGATVDVLITPSVCAYLKFFTSPNGVNWDILLPGAVYTEPISRTFTQPQLGAYVKCEVYGGIGSVTLSASGRTIPPLEVDAKTTIQGADLWAGSTLTMTPATISGGTTPYETIYLWQMFTSKWETVSNVGLTYQIPSGDQYIGKRLRAQTKVTDSSSMWDVEDNVITSNSSEVVIVAEPVPPISITTDTSISGTAKIGHTLTAVAPSWTGGGDESSVTSYEWVNSSNYAVLSTATSYEIDPNDQGYQIRLRATISSTEESVYSLSAPTATIPAQVTIGNLTVSVNGVANTGDPVEISLGQTATLSVTYDGDSQSSQLNYYWDIRQGNGTIADAYSKDAIYTAPDAAGTSQVICTLTNPDASDSPQTTIPILFVNTTNFMR
jgi:hypothetical protein